MSHEILICNNTIGDRRDEMFLSVTQNKNCSFVSYRSTIMYLLISMLNISTHYSVVPRTIYLFIYFMTNQNELAEVNEECTFCQFYFLRRIDISHNYLC